MDPKVEDLIRKIKEFDKILLQERNNEDNNLYQSYKLHIISEVYKYHFQNELKNEN